MLRFFVLYAPWLIGGVFLLSALVLGLTRWRQGGWRPQGIGGRAGLALGGLLLALGASLLVTYFTRDLAGVRRAWQRIEAAQGKRVPKFVFRRVTDDRTDRLAAYRGKVVLLNVWSTT